MGGRTISNKEFEEALCSQCNQAIMGSACAPFRKSIDFDELHSIKLMSLWIAMQRWRPGGKKFTSFLFLQTRWQCIKVVQEQVKNPVYDVSFDRQAKRVGNFNELIELLPDDLRGIFISRFVRNMTLREIAREHNFCAETGRRKILKGLSILKESHQF